jgi:hypothetical protein
MPVKLWDGVLSICSDLKWVPTASEHKEQQYSLRYPHPQPNPENQATEKQNIIIFSVVNTTFRLILSDLLCYLLLQAFVQSHGTLLSLFVALFTCETAPLQFI